MLKHNLRNCLFPAIVLILALVGARTTSAILSSQTTFLPVPLPKKWISRRAFDGACD